MKLTTAWAVSLVLFSAICLKRTSNFSLSSFPRFSVQVNLAENHGGGGGGTDLCVSHDLRSLYVLRELNASPALLGFRSAPAEDSSVN